MNEMKLYRVLQIHAGNINALVIKLYKGEITADEALSVAINENHNLTEKIKEIKST
jgi:hypothetical protein